MTAIKSEKAAEIAARHIESLIVEGTLYPNQPLLPERELAERLGISRPTLRDALKILQNKGMLDGGNGRGMRVAKMGAAISDPLMALLADRAELTDDYLEFRDIVESQAAAMAATRANEVDLRRISDCLDRMETAHSNGNAIEEAEADAALHLLIYEASHNLVLLQVMRALSGNLRRDVIHNRGRLFTLPETRDALRDQHYAIAGAILARNADAARTAAHHHLTYIRKCLRDIREADVNLGISRRRDEGGGLAAPDPSP